jgi:hypothetical protein
MIFFSSMRRHYLRTALPFRSDEPAKHCCLARDRAGVNGNPMPMKRARAHAVRDPKLAEKERSDGPRYSRETKFWKLDFPFQHCHPVTLFECVKIGASPKFQKKGRHALSWELTASMVTGKNI